MLTSRFTHFATRMTLFCSLMAAAPACAEGCTCLGDLDGDRTVGGADLGQVLSAWGTADVSADLDGSGLVDGADLGNMLSRWGGCPAPVNDDCANPLPVVASLEASYSFCTVDANTNDMHNWSVDCSSAVSVVSRDLWYEFEAPFTGLLQVNLFSDFPGMLVVYGSSVPGESPCPTSGDGGPAPCLGYAHASEPSVFVNVIGGNLYKFRVGTPSWPDEFASGSGSFQVWMWVDSE